jgi:hypothetical protein
VGDLNSPLSSIERIVRQKIYKDILELNNTTHKMDITDIYVVFLPTTADCIFFSVVHGTFFKIDNILSVNANLNK